MTTPASRSRADEERIRLRTVVDKGKRPGRIDHAGHVDVVLDQNGYAVQRPSDLARLPLGVTRLGVPIAVGIDVDHRIELRPAIVNRRNAIEIRARQGTRGERAGGHAPLRLGDAQIDDVDGGAAAATAGAAGGRHTRQGNEQGKNEQGKNGQGAHGHGRDGSGVVSGDGPIIADRRAGSRPGTTTTGGRRVRGLRAGAVRPTSRPRRRPSDDALRMGPAAPFPAPAAS